jgi:3D (Asp-Asp-Asp) domain-containing protein/peptidoglycan hydrolase CwlO-like protein
LRTFCLAVLVGTAACATLPGASSAENAAELERQAQALRNENETLAAGSQAASSSLAAIEAGLAQARAELASFRARAARVRVERRAVTEQLLVVRTSLRATRRALDERLQTLYEEGETDTLAIVLGAGSLDAALNAVQTLDLAAKQDEELLHKARRAARRLSSLSRTLASRERELEQLAAVRAAAAASLTEARSERLQAIAALRATGRSNAARIAALEERSRALASVPTAPAPVADPVQGAPRIEPGPASRGVHSLTVMATGYSLSGRTASGAPVGWGAVAVDPVVIPMGSRLSVPGYGLGVAADTGGAIRGSKIDLWFPTVGQARAWGSRVVTITVYSS